MPTQITKEGKTLEAIQRIHVLALNPKTSFTELATGFINIGLELFNMKIGIVSEVEEQTYSVFKVNQNTFGIKERDIFELGKTFCKEVFEKKVTVTHINIGNDKDLKNHPAYQTSKLESYMGSPLRLGAKIYGTLNFSSDMLREEISILELQVFESMAFFLSKQLEKDFQSNINRLFLRNLAHEMRTPLNGIMGFSEILTDTELDQEQFEMVDLIARSAKGLEETINDLSAFIKAEKSEFMHKSGKINLAESVNVLIKELEDKINFQNAFVKSQIADNIELSISEEAFQSIISYLIKDCLSRRRERKELVLTLKEDEEFIHIFLTDNGPHLTKAVTLILNTFGRLEYSQSSFHIHGLTLNLSLSSILIQQLGGHLRAEVIDQEKTEFHLAFPKGY
jgi:signal transduction histidine kinase